MWLIADREKDCMACILVIMPYAKKWSGRQANSRRLSVGNFDRENVDKLIKIHQIC